MKIRLLVTLSARCLLYGLIFFCFFGVLIMDDLKDGIIIGLVCSPSFLISGLAIASLVALYKEAFCKKQH